MNVETTQIPPGMNATEAEIYFDGRTLQIIYNKKVYPWVSMPNVVKEWLTQELNADAAALAKFKEIGVNRMVDMLYQYAKCRFGGYNLTPDLSQNTNVLNSEHWECGCKSNTQCCLRPLFRNALHVKNGTLNAREIQIAKSIALGNPVKNIADEMHFSIPTIDKIKQSIFLKTGFSNSTQIAKWASRINLV